MLFSNFDFWFSVITDNRNNVRDWRRQRAGRTDWGTGRMRGVNMSQFSLKNGSRQRKRRRGQWKRQLEWVQILVRLFWLIERRSRLFDSVLSHLLLCSEVLGWMSVCVHSYILLLMFSTRLLQHCRFQHSIGGRVPQIDCFWLLPLLWCFSVVLHMISPAL